MSVYIYIYIYIIQTNAYINIYIYLSLYIYIYVYMYMSMVDAGVYVLQQGSGATALQVARGVCAGSERRNFPLEWIFI